MPHRDSVSSYEESAYEKVGPENLVRTSVSGGAGSCGGSTYEQVGRARDANQLPARIGQAVDIGGRTLTSTALVRVRRL
jgi:hypothetical protein